MPTRRAQAKPENAVRCAMKENWALAICNYLLVAFCVEYKKEWIMIDPSREATRTTIYMRRS